MRAIAEERGLYRLRLTTTNRPEPDSMCCALLRGKEVLVDDWTVPQTALGLEAPGSGQGSSGGRGARDPGAGARLADYVAAELAKLAPHLPSGEVLWLDLVSPKGGLIFLPWEDWLVPIFERPVLRLPRFSLQPVRPPGRLHVAFCSSTPRAKAELPVSEMARATYDALRAARVKATLHVFVDGEQAERVGSAFDRGAIADGRVLIYPAAGPESAGEDGKAGRDLLSSPWLRWMREALPPRGVDLIQFANHGYLARGRGSLAFARSPSENDDPAWSRFVDATELTRFLDHIGAGGVVLTSPPEDFSPSGLLALADELVATRPGPVLYHCGTKDHDCRELSRAFAFLFGRGEAPQSGALSLWAHPDQLRAAESAAQAGGMTAAARPRRGDVALEGLDELEDEPAAGGDATQDWKGLYRGGTDRGAEVERESSQTILDRYTLARQYAPRPRQRTPWLGRGQHGGGHGGGGLEGMEEAAPPPRGEGGGDPLEAEAPPRWLQSSQRILERHAAQLANTELGESDRRKSVQKGEAEALRYVAELLGDSGPEGGEGPEGGGGGPS